MFTLQLVGKEGLQWKGTGYIQLHRWSSLRQKALSPKCLAVKEAIASVQPPQPGQKEEDWWKTYKDAIVPSHVGKGHDRIYFSLMWTENSYIIMHKYKQLHHTLSKRSLILDMSIRSCMWHWKIISSESDLCNNKGASQLFACDTAFLGFNFGKHFLHMVDVLMHFALVIHRAQKVTIPFTSSLLFKGFVLLAIYYFCSAHTRSMGLISALLAGVCHQLIPCSSR